MDIVDFPFRFFFVIWCCICGFSYTVVMAAKAGNKFGIWLVKQFRKLYRLRQFLVFIRSQNGQDYSVKWSGRGRNIHDIEPIIKGRFDCEVTKIVEVKP